MEVIQVQWLNVTTFSNQIVHSIRVNHHWTRIPLRLLVSWPANGHLPQFSHHRHSHSQNYCQTHTHTHTHTHILIRLHSLRVKLTIHLSDWFRYELVSILAHPARFTEDLAVYVWEVIRLAVRWSTRVLVIALQMDHMLATFYKYDVLHSIVVFIDTGSQLHIDWA